MIVFGKTVIIGEDCTNEEQKGLRDLWLRLPKNEKVVCMDYLSCVVQVKVPCEFIDAWLEQWRKDFEGVPLATTIDVAHRRTQLDRECACSSPNLLRPVDKEKGHDPRFSQVLSQAVIESVQCHIFADILMEAIYRKMSRAARMLGYHYSGQSHEYMDYTEKLLSKWSLPAESEELDPEFERSFLDGTDCSTEVSDDMQTFHLVAYLWGLFRKSVSCLGKLLFQKKQYPVSV